MNFIQVLSLLCVAVHGASASAFFLTAYSDIEFEGGGDFFYNNLTAYQSAFIVNNRTTAARGPVTVFNSTDLPGGITSGGHLEMVLPVTLKTRKAAETDTLNRTCRHRVANKYTPKPMVSETASGNNNDKEESNRRSTNARSAENSGLLRFTAPGSAIPPSDAFGNLFTSELDQDVSGPEFKVGFNGTCGPDEFWCSMYACPLSDPGLTGFYQVYAPTTSSDLAHCLGFRMAGGEPGSELAYPGGIAAGSY